MTCCYLCRSSFECSLKKGGVFVPLQDHFEQYCLTDNFTHCHHFIQSALACGVASPSFCKIARNISSEQGERRSFVRKKAAFTVTLSAYDQGEGQSLDGDNVDSVCNTFAQTVDLAQGGMRVRAATRLVKQGILLFNFGEEFIAPLLHGFAEVCWQKTCEDTGHWEAGLSFKDQFVKAIIAVQLSA